MKIVMKHKVRCLWYKISLLDKVYKESKLSFGPKSRLMFGPKSRFMASSCDLTLPGSKVPGSLVVFCIFECSVLEDFQWRKPRFNLACASASIILPCLTFYTNSFRAIWKCSHISGQIFAIKGIVRVPFSVSALRRWRS